MKKLGLLGGVGPESTIPYYRGIVYGVQKKVGRPYFPPLTIESLSTFEVLRMSSQGLREELAGVFFKHPFEQAGMEVATPSDAEKEWIEQKITDELEFGIVKPETVSEFQKIVKHMAEQNGIQAVILGCTELPMLFKDATLSVPVLDTMQIHIAALVEKIMENGGIEL